MFKKSTVFILHYTQPAFYSQSAVCILHSVCILPLVRSLQSAVRSLRFTLTAFKTNCWGFSRDVNKIQTNKLSINIKSNQSFIM